ncbi:MAG TPA: hypothetical protein VHE55_10325 [Fimbriimonadaceae bacterium]|nr:hypothetical protein [Fimbriimonadaceae bacterium]
MKGLRFCLLALVLGVLAGCARVSTTTTIRADGSFTRKTVYTIMPDTAISGMTDAKPKGPADYFKLPAKGPGVDVVQVQDKTNTVVTVTREVPAGAAPLQDIVLLGGKGGVLAASTVAVTKLADGRIEYVETLHRLSPPQSIPDMTTLDLRARVKKALPAEDQRTELIDRLTKLVTINLVHAVMGPPEPNLFNLVFSPDSAARRVNTFAFNANVATFKAEVPNITEAQAAAMARSLVDLLNPSAFDAGKVSQEPKKPESDENELMPIFFSIKFPGTVVETDGLTDPMSGEVYWSLLPMVLDLGDVKLRAVVEP